MTDHRGTFVWFELMSANVDAANAFYEALLGWKPQDAGNPAMKYTIMNVGDRGIAGTFGMSTEACAAGGKASWSGFIAVDDVDAKARRIVELGGAVTKGPMDIPGIGRFARVTDPQGAPFLIFKPVPPAGAVPATLPSSTHGVIAWHELHAKDWTQAWPFYEELFNWTKSTAVDMGPMGTYQLFKTSAGDEIGGMMTSPMAPSWLYYASVANIDEAIEKAKQLGGKTMNGPHEVPGGVWTVQVSDPEGVMFAMVGPRK
ncbi:MAG: VOC family protein [Polyangia bacterium]